MKARAFVLAVLLAICPAVLHAQWAATHGTVGDDYLYDLLPTPDGGSVVLWQGGLLKLSAGGEKEWDIAPSIPSLSRWNHVWLLQDGGFLAVAGDAVSVLYIFKMSAAGGIVWQKKFTGATAVDFCGATDDGGAFLAGTIGQGDESKPWVLKVAPGGDIEWQKMLALDHPSEPALILAASGGGCMVVGRYARDLMLGLEADLWVAALGSTGEVQWQKTIAWGAASGYERPLAVQQAPDGGFVVSAYTDSEGAEGSGLLLTKLTPQGSVEWLKLAGGFRGTLNVRTTSGGHILAAWAGDRELHVMELAPDGTIVWQKLFQGERDIYYVLGIGPTPDGGCAVALRTDIATGAYTTNVDGCLVKLTPTGEIAWQKYLGNGCFEDALESVEPMGDGGVLAAGRTRTWGWKDGGLDIWLIKLTPEGEVNPYCAFIANADLAATETDFVVNDVPAVVRQPAMTVTADPVSPEVSEVVTTANRGAFKRLCTPQSTISLAATAGGTTDPAPGNHTYETGTQVTLKAIVNDKDYKFSSWSGVCPTSVIDNPMTFVLDGDRAVTAIFTKPPKDDGGLDEDWMDNEGSLNFCFIATAAYGSPLHPHVRDLREFRDRYLNKSGAGRAAVRLYYRLSPPVAAFIAKHKAAKAAVRILLLPAVGFAHLALKTGPVPATLALVIITFGGALFVRRRRRAHKARARKVI